MINSVRLRRTCAEAEKITENDTERTVERPSFLIPPFLERNSLDKEKDYGMIII